MPSAYLSHDLNEAVQDYTAVTATSADSEYPVSNLAVLPITEVWRSAAGALSAVDLKFDFGSAKSVRLIALVNHNLSATATIAIAAGTTTAYASFSDTVSWREFDAFKYLSAVQSYRHWRIRITDTANLDNFLQVGYVMLGNPTALTSTFAFGMHRISEFHNLEVQSEFGVKHVDRMYRSTRYLIEFRNKTSGVMDSIETIYETAERNMNPLFFIPVTSESRGHFGRFVTQFDVLREVVRTASMEFEEESRGKKLAA